MKKTDWPIQKVTINHKNYPAILKTIKRPPQEIFFRGQLEQSLFKKSLAVVGTRRITRYGVQATERLVTDLVAHQVTIVSGFMYGVDAQAHAVTLAAGGQTVAVLGGGLNAIGQEDEKLYQEILAAKGVILSEYPPEFKPQLWTFPQRNRIVAGLACLGVLVIEAGQKSGSLITVRLAKQQGKKVFAVPGPITSSVSAGTNQLIQAHQARMVLSVTDILGRKIETPSLFSLAKLSSLEQKIFNALQREPLTADEIALQVSGGVISINQTLSLMGLKGLIEETAGKFYLKS